jgi:hypothetical protein
MHESPHYCGLSASRGAGLRTPYPPNPIPFVIISRRKDSEAPTSYSGSRAEPSRRSIGVRVRLPDYTIPRFTITGTRPQSTSRAPGGHCTSCRDNWVTIRSARR